MKNKIDIEFEKIIKSYGLYKNDFKRILAIIFGGKFINNKLVLKNISLKIKVGEKVCLIGRNGCGKSTILKIISGITTETGGSLFIGRRVSSLINVAIGFEENFTGRENIYIRGALLGISKRKMNNYIDDIIKFSEIEVEMIDQELKRYSSGMIAKLGFSINLISEPQILIIDEALAVGDAVFIEKCIKKMELMAIDENLTILFVSHSKKLATSICDRGIYIKDGTISFDGTSIDAFKHYYKDNNIPFDK